MTQGSSCFDLCQCCGEAQPGPPVGRGLEAGGERLSEAEAGDLRHERPGQRSGTAG